MITMYGIPNCDTVKKARNWLTEHGITYVFHDFKKSGVPAEIDRWTRELGWETVLNRKGTTWRKLDADTQAAAHDAASAAALLREHPSAIKRPIVDWNGRTLTAGFTPEVWATLQA